MDGYFNQTNTSMYNIYDKCYKTPNVTEEDDLEYINTGCEDNAGIMTFLNDAHVKENWNIKEQKEWQPCNKKIFMEYQGDRNAFDHLPFLIKNHLRIVCFLIFSGFIRVILTPIYRLLELRSGFRILGILLICLSKEFGGSGGFQADTKERIRLEVSSGNFVTLLS